MSNKNSSIKSEKPSLLATLLYFLEGMLVGVGGVIPGLSGGVMCAIFGIYQPLMEVLAHPLKNIKKHWRLLLPVLIGVGVGFVGLSKLVLWLFSSNQQLAVCLFTGLILGMLPSLYGEAKEKGKLKSSYIIAGAVFLVLFGIMVFLSVASDVAVTPNRFWDAMSGVFWGIGFIVPGMSASTPLMFLHLYDEAFLPMVSSFFDHAIEFVKGNESFITALSSMQWTEALFFAIGLIGFIAIFARPVDMLLKKFPSQMYHAILAVVVATVLPIVIFQIDWGNATIAKIACIIIGFAFAWLIDLAGKKLTPRT